MHSSENSRRSQAQRWRPDLNINTSNAANRGRDSLPAMPSTPPTRTKTKPPVSGRASYRVPPSTSTTASRDSEESFLDNGSDEIRGNEPDLPNLPRGRNARDSHDLSFPSRQFTRDSLVTNMLSSLDQFSLGQIHTPTTNLFDDDPLGLPRRDDYSKSMTSTTRPGRMWSNSLSHGHGYSYSSDFDGTDDGASRASDQYSRGRRSNSSSGFQSSLGRINSLRERSHPGTSGGRVLHSRGGKTSKSSSTNSIDAGYAQVLTTQRWAHGIGGRSSSFDYGQRPSLSSPNAWKTEFSNTFLVDDYEAAPTPTIPVGPRRPNMPSSPAAPPPIPPPEPESKTPDRKNSARSRSGTARTTQSKYAPSSREPPPPMPSTEMDSAPAPHIGYEKSKEVLHGTQGQPPQTKPGFFSRIFGYRNTTPTSDAKPTPVASTSADAAEQSGNRLQNVASQTKAQSTPPSRDSQFRESQRSASQPHVVQKKSSFFRRRKKSVTEPPMPPPPIPLPREVTQLKEQSAPQRESSPVSSLREIMSPYLQGITTNIPSGGLLSPTQENARARGYESQDEDSSRKVRGFSPDYEPSPNATIRTVKSTSALRNQESARRRSQMDSSSRDLPELPTKKFIETRDTTFFHDSSDEGENPRATGKQKQKPPRSNKSSPMVNDSRDRFESIQERPVTGIDNEELSKREPSPKLVLQHHSTFEGGRPKPVEGRDGPRRMSTFPSSLNKSDNGLPSVKVDSAEGSPKVVGSPLDEPEVSVGEPTEDDRQKAQKIFDGNEDFIQKEKAASWMGEEGLVRQRTLRAYMELYDFTDQSVLTALRQICSRLILRAETQQVDRILVAFSTRWCDCNPNHGFKTMDVIHTMCYSIMLLNTDLHLADIDQKMTKSQFVKNTMTTIKHALVDSAPEAFDRASVLPGKNSLLSPSESETVMSYEPEPEMKLSWRTSFKPIPLPLPRSDSSMGNYSDGPVDTCGPLVKTPFEGTMKAWMQQMEQVLKEIYSSIRDEKLPLFGAEPSQPPSQTQSTLSVMGVLKRSPSVLSKAPSEGQIPARGRINEPVRPPPGSRWNSKSRSRPRFPGNGMSSSRTSFDDGNSVWSPTTSSATWSRYSLGRTQTSMSVDSFGSYPHGDYQQSIGFANALSQAIIREDVPPGTSGQSIMSDDFQANQLLEDETLELAGPPWVKEGIVIHKHHLDGIDKKAKDRNWTEVFAVVQKGTMSLFSFSSKSMRQKSRGGRKPPPGAVVGGGNWQENATSVGTFSLRQTLASALPAPGYSRSRPHVWALSLPTGAVHLFQVGTPDISNEFVLAVNYWSARLSTHPLVGGVSNIEYGWSDAIINNALVTAINDPPPPPRPGSAAAGRSSMHSRQGSLQSSIRSSFEVGGSSRTKLPGDRIHIAEWTPPAQSLRPSNASEAEQLETLEAYVKSIEEDLKKHNQLRSPMLLAFTPRGHNSTKAMANWERKSSYLLRENVKFSTYVDCLQIAKTKRAEIYAERENARRAARGEDLDEDEGEHDAEADVTIQVDEE
ncbi:uncharacterized protein F4807DRAFT_454912 [Annulohypoxylon truncatum]|uniref:uncharacterized protein n=1 Tax=Annulohypoxylon truncatum TaxID=327061 RepID=UPI0020072963|nr:uncharacterized protein F4807DRAFT_454912 [Annulohypoxylon truncatum]KAI1204094.1 hypothetical protein F4807DRAFT_454912 [Annulohypoxylon truncatum]